jgi:hypothetical protein
MWPFCLIIGSCFSSVGLSGGLIDFIARCVVLASFLRIVTLPYSYKALLYLFASFATALSSRGVIYLVML